MKFSKSLLLGILVFGGLVFVFSSLVFIPAAKALNDIQEECYATYEKCEADKATCAEKCVLNERICRGGCDYEEYECIAACGATQDGCENKCITDYECVDPSFCESFASPGGSPAPSSYSECYNTCSSGASEGTSAFETCLSNCMSPELPQYTAPTQPPQNLKSASGRFGKLGVAAGLGGAKSFEETVGGVIKGALALVGTIFLMLMVYGGYIWMTARGEEEEAKRARNIITMAIFGISVIMAAYAITYFIVARLTTG